MCSNSSLKRRAIASLLTLQIKVGERGRGGEDMEGGRRNRERKEGKRERKEGKRERKEEKRESRLLHKKSSANPLSTPFLIAILF